MNIDDLTIGQIKDLQRLLSIGESPDGVPAHPYPLGEAVFIRSVTMHYTGRLVRVTAGELVLVDAAWIADSGRFHTALMKGTLSEVEPFPSGEVVIPRGGLIDVSRWNHALPRDQK